MMACNSWAMAAWTEWSVNVASGLPGKSTLVGAHQDDGRSKKERRYLKGFQDIMETLKTMQEGVM